MIQLWLLLSLASLFWDSADARTDPPAPTEVVIIGEIDTVHVESGDSTFVEIPITISQGHRVMANPASGEFLIPLEIVFERTQGVEVHAPIYSEPSPYRLEGTEKDLMTYQGSTAILVPVTIEAAIGVHHLSGELRFQACTGQRCLFPTTVPVEVPIVVVPTES